MHEYTYVQGDGLLKVQLEPFLDVPTTFNVKIIEDISLVWHHCYRNARKVSIKSTESSFASGLQLPSSSLRNRDTNQKYPPYLTFNKHVTKFWTDGL